MSRSSRESELCDLALSGDRAALHELLFDHYEQLVNTVSSQIPSSLQGVLGAEDIVQQTLVDAIRDIEKFTPQTDHSLTDWLKRIAKNRTIDAIRHFKAAKRGGNHHQICGPTDPQASSVADLVDVLIAESHTPSRSVARHEAVAAVQQAIDSLADDYRQAVQLRLLEGKSLQETANIMNRSPGAVQGLVDRARKKMRGVLGRLSLYE